MTIRLSIPLAASEGDPMPPDMFDVAGDRWRHNPAYDRVDAGQARDPDRSFRKAPDRGRTIRAQLGLGAPDRARGPTRAKIADWRYGRLASARSQIFCPDRMGHFGAVSSAPATGGRISGIVTERGRVRVFGGRDGLRLLIAAVCGQYRAGFATIEGDRGRVAVGPADLGVRFRLLQAAGRGLYDRAPEREYRADPARQSAAGARISADSGYFVA